MDLPSSSLSKKFFGYCKVQWKIDNFSVQTKDITQEWLIESPEFTINSSERTSWCMNIRSKLINKNSFVLFNLRRSATDSGPKYIQLNLKMFCVCSSEKSLCCNDVLLSLKRGSKHEIFLGSLSYLLSEMDKLDSFTIVCLMIVQSNSVNREYGECNHAGINLLSKNMLDLYRSSQNFDTKLFFGDNLILAHKAVLCARNECLCSIIVDDDAEIEDTQGYTVLNFTGMLYYKGMKKVLAYLYTGDMRHVLQEPSYDIYYCASFLGIREIEDHYEPDELILKSTVDLQEYIYILRDYKFENSRFIWHFKAEEATKTCQLLFCPRKDQNNVDYVPLFTKTFEVPMNIRLEFDFADVKSGHLFSISLVAIKDPFIDLDNMIGKILQERHCNHDTFEVTIKVKLTTGVTISYIDWCKSVCVSYVNEDFNYERFSADMEYLLDDGPFTDTLIDANGTYFWAHRCMLASRSEFFSHMLIANEEADYLVLNIEPRILCVLLTYIYSGFLYGVVNEDVVEVYKAAVLSKMPFLQSACSNWLKQCSRTDRDMKCRVVRLAEEYKDAPLMKAVLSHLFDRKDVIATPNSFFSFQDVHTCRYC